MSHDAMFIQNENILGSDMRIHQNKTENVITNHQSEKQKNVSMFTSRLASCITK